MEVAFCSQRVPYKWKAQSCGQNVVLGRESLSDQDADGEEESEPEEGNAQCHRRLICSQTRRGSCALKIAVPATSTSVPACRMGCALESVMPPSISVSAWLWQLSMSCRRSCILWSV